MKKAHIGIIIFILLTAIMVTSVGCSKEIPKSVVGEYTAGESDSIVGTLKLSDDGSFTLVYKGKANNITVRGQFSVSGSKIKFNPDEAKKFSGSIVDEKITFTYDGIAFNFHKKVEVPPDGTDPDDGEDGEDKPESSGFNCEHFYTKTFELSGDTIKSNRYSNTLKPYVGEFENARFGFLLKNELIYKSGFFSRIFMDNEQTKEVTNGIVPVNFGDNYCYLVIDSVAETNLAVYKFNIYVVKEYTVSLMDVSVLTGVETKYKDYIVYENKSLENVVNPTQDNVTFVNWVTEDGKIFDMKSRINTNITLRATYNKVAVTFNWDSGNKKILYVTKGESCNIAELPTPKPDGYALEGWYTASGEKWDTASICTKNISVTARWKEDNISDYFTFTYIPGGQVGQGSFTLTEYKGNKEYIIIPEKYKADIVSAADKKLGLTEGIELPVTAIADGVFKGKDNITDIVIPESIVTIGTSAFEDCTNLKRIKLPKNLDYIHSSLFAGCRKLEEIILPDTVSGIGASAFSGCTMLKSVNIPQSVTGIGAYAFNNCAMLKIIFIPNGVTYIGNYTFKSCKNLTIKTAHITTPPEWAESWNPDGRHIEWESK